MKNKPNSSFNGAVGSAAANVSVGAYVGRVSWDVFIMRFPPELGNIPENWDPPSLGSGREVRAVLAQVLQGIEFSPGGWGDYEGPGFSISTPVNEADDAPVAAVSLFIHGGNEAAAHAALAVADALQARAYDTGSGDFLTAESARSAFEAWRAYRDRVLDEHGT
ncbi:hypothetical protein [Streptomyces caniscabiei]|nr:hypothetical protein [Streptomyces caniscabiei]WEO29618.1 hypothetical protein IHE65_44215 [Streptomyces caniscabiei]